MLIRFVTPTNYTAFLPMDVNNWLRIQNYIFDMNILPLLLENYARWAFVVFSKKNNSLR